MRQFVPTAAIAAVLLAASVGVAIVGAEEPTPPAGEALNLVHTRAELVAALARGEVAHAIWLGELQEFHPGGFPDPPYTSVQETVPAGQDPRTIVKLKFYVYDIGQGGNAHP